MEPTVLQFLLAELENWHEKPKFVQEETIKKAIEIQRNQTIDIILKVTNCTMLEAIQYYNKLYKK
jgi:hypothetical protein